MGLSLLPGSDATLRATADTSGALAEGRGTSNAGACRCESASASVQGRETEARRTVLEGLRQEPPQAHGGPGAGVTLSAYYRA